MIYIYIFILYIYLFILYTYILHIDLFFSLFVCLFHFIYLRFFVYIDACISTYGHVLQHWQWIVFSWRQTSTEWWETNIIFNHLFKTKLP